MAFGFVPDVLILTVAFVLTTINRHRIAEAIRRLPLPEFMLYVLAALPLLAFEEHINCIPEWCMQVLIPPTIWFLLIQLIVVWVLIKWRKVKRFWTTVTVFSAYGVLFELILGPSKGFVFALDPLLVVFMLVWVWISYAFTIIVPLTIVRLSELEKDPGSD